jgi:aspartate racemase
MKRLGLLGGMSWESSVLYERHINEAVRERLGGVASADLIIRSFNFADIEALQAQGDWEGAGRVLGEAAFDLQSAGAQAIVLCTNTMHQVASDIESHISIPLLHIVTATGEAITRAGVKKVALLGTRYTMERPFYKDTLSEQFDVEVVTPDQAGRDEIHRIIYDELVQGMVDPKSKEKVLAIIAGLQHEHGIEGVIAACTEIELLIHRSDLDLPYFPTTEIHARYAAHWALGGKEER